VVNPRDYEICRAIANADEKRQVRIIANDVVEEQADMVRKGTISATICQEPEKQGEMPLEILFQYLAYGTVPEERMQYTNLSIHIAQNL
ncbi:MAG: LacI family transcriptional regulator, partial [Lachnospiraceae bacterium]|nr:LacI family transcriptional regulator [Lachnospiraceae bacterium]